MGSLALLRGISNIVARLAMRPGSGGHPTDRWQDKSREARGGRLAGMRGMIKDLAQSSPVVGRLVARGLDDELSGTAYAVIDGIDGRAHHIRLPDLDAAGDSGPGSIVELRRYEDSKGRPRLALAVRSDLTVEAQVKANGATWLDRQLLARE